MSVAEVDNRLTIQDFLRPDFWLSLNPGLHIEDREFCAQNKPFNIAPELRQEVRDLVRREGYFHLPGPVPWNLSIDTMREAVGTLKAANLSPVFAYVYDDFWVVFAKLHYLIQAALGAEYLVMPDFWAWHVDPKAGEAGWTPHRDKGRRSLFEDGTPKSLTVWLPLSNANPLNGCMYMLPADRDPTYGTEDEKNWKVNLPDVRALPASAGDIFCWNQAVLHWGARSSPRASEPRVSLAFEFQLASVEPFNTPLMPALNIPTLGQRISLICKQILQYKHMYPLSKEMQALAEEGLQLAR